MQAFKRSSCSANEVNPSESPKSVCTDLRKLCYDKLYASYLDLCVKLNVCAQADLICALEDNKLISVINDELREIWSKDDTIFDLDGNVQRDCEQLYKKCFVSIPPKYARNFLDKCRKSLNESWIKEFHSAVNRRELEKVKRLVRLGINVDEKNKDGNTAFHLAAVKRDRAMIKFLISICDINAQNKYENTALHLLITSENLFSTSVHRDYADRDPEDIAILNMLVECPGIKLDILGRHECSPLHAACLAHRVDIANLLISRMGPEVNMQLLGEPIGNFLSRNNRNLPILKSLYAHPEFKADAQCYMRGYNGLHVAMEMNADQIIEYHVQQNKINVNAKELRGLTPLGVGMEICTRSNFESFKALSKASGLTVTCKDIESISNWTEVFEPERIIECLWPGYES